MDFLNTYVMGNSVETWLGSVGAGALTAGLLWILVPRLIRQVRRFARSTSTYVDDVIAAAAGATSWILYVAAGIDVGAGLLNLPDRVESVIDGVLVSALLVQVGLWSVAGLRTFIVLFTRERYPDDPAVATSMNVVRYLATGTVWFLVLVFGLQAWGVDVTALITGLGIGGIAIALAVQSVLSDLFASLSIVLDKPFLVGDSLAIDDYRGTVEDIGLKTTKLRSISGEQLIFSNGDLLKSRIRNYGRMSERRGGFSFGIVYETDPDVVAAIPEWVKEIVEREENTRFDRCHFKRLGDWALEYEIVYHLTVPDYTSFMDVQQSINLALMRRLAAAGVDFAYPTQLHYERSEETPKTDGPRQVHAG